MMTQARFVRLASARGDTFQENPRGYSITLVETGPYPFFCMGPQTIAGLVFGFALKQQPQDTLKQRQPFRDENDDWQSDIRAWH